MDNQKLSVKPQHGFGFIYQYTSPSGKIYIGKTKTTLKERAQKHAKGYKGCKAFYNAIQKYGWENFEVTILEEVPLDILDEREVEYIMELDATDSNKGYNIVTDIQTYLSVLNRIPVYSYDSKTGEFIEKFTSTAEAERTLNVYHGSVRRVLNLSNRTCKGRLWKTEFFDKVEPFVLEPQKTWKKVYIYDAKTGNLLKEFDSIRQAARETGYNRSTIQEQLQKEQVLKSKKYIFRYFKVGNLFNESSTTIP